MIQDVMPRRNVTTDEQTEYIIETMELNASKVLRETVKERYGSVELMEQRRNALENRLDTLLKEKQEIEREMREVEKKKDRLDNLLVKNDVMQQIRSNEEYRKEYEQKLSVIKRRKAEGVSKAQVEQFVEKNAEVLAEDLPFGVDDLEHVLKEGVGL